MTQRVKNLPAMQETRVSSLGEEDSLEKGMATHSGILAWRISWTEEPIKLNEIIKKSVDRQRNSRNCAQKHTSIRMSSRDMKRCWRGMASEVRKLVPWQLMKRGFQGVGSDQLLSYWLIKEDENWEFPLDLSTWRPNCSLTLREQF